jgi:hypothetical protein
MKYSITPADRYTIKQTDGKTKTKDIMNRLMNLALPFVNFLETIGRTKADRWDDGADGVTPVQVQRAADAGRDHEALQEGARS